MQKFLLIGNSPSSGSTFLSELIDAADGFLSGPELALFTHRNLYSNYLACRDSGDWSFSSLSPSVYRHRNLLKFDRLKYYGLSREAFLSIFNSCASFEEFVLAIRSAYLSYRKEQPLDAIWIEKTPENINCLPDYLKYFPNNHFIHIVRNPLYVADSLFNNRKFPFFISLLTWWFDIAMLMKYSSSSRVVTIKYENLVKQPFDLTSRLLSNATGRLVDPGKIAQTYQFNPYRKKMKRIKGWTVSGHAEIQNCNARSIHPMILAGTKTLLNYKISESYAKKYGINQVSFLEAIKYFGYDDEVLEALSHVKSKRFLKMPRDFKLLFTNWWSDYKAKDASIASLSDYFDLIEHV